MASAALETHALGKRYGRKWALRDCELSLPPGRVIGLIGPNGAGKTTLLHLLVGLIAPTTGRISFFGDPLRARSGSTLAKVGFVAQDHPLYRSFSVTDLLHLGRALNPSWDQVLAEGRLRHLEISPRQRAGKLSGGQQAQVALTMALAKRPSLLVLDEPVASLDPLARRDFMRTLIDSAAADQLTVLLSSHVVAELERVCDHVILLRDGQVQLTGDVDDLLHSHRLFIGSERPGDAITAAPGLVSVAEDERRTNVLIRVRNGEDPDFGAGWERRPVRFEDLALAYLERTGAPLPPEDEPETRPKRGA